jgi:hypothetical protein
MVIALLTSCEESDKYTVVIDTDDLIYYVEYTTDRKIEYIIAEAFDANITAHKWHNGIGRIYFDKPITTIDWFLTNGWLLDSVTIPNCVTTIESFAFHGCSSLTSINIPDSVTSIGSFAFQSCYNLGSVTIGNGVREIDSNAFEYCDKLTSIYCKATTPPALGNDVFYRNNASGRMIYVPRNSVNAYKSASGWSRYSADIVGYDF